jgi:hypothetical protein
MSKYDPKATAALKFMRYGGLSSVNQRGYGNYAEDYHGPPASRGFYCFVWPYCELFLLGNGDTTSDPKYKGTKFSYLKDSKGNIINDKHPDAEAIGESGKYWGVNTREWTNYYKNWPDYDSPDYDEKSKALDEAWGDKPKYVFTKKPKPKIFTYLGDIWHHLGKHLKPYQILMTKGDWVKTSMFDYRQALDKEMHGCRKDSLNDFVMDVKSKWYHEAKRQGKNPFRWISKDHLECFIEKL